MLFQTGCGMVVTTGYPKTAFRIPYLHNLFQNGAATLSGVVEVFHQKQKRGEYPDGQITFIMVSGDGGMDIGMGSALGTALRGHCMIIFEYDNGGYMNTGYQLSYSTPMGARSSTSHVGNTSMENHFSTRIRRSLWRRRTFLISQRLPNQILRILSERLQKPPPIPGKLEWPNPKALCLPAQLE